MYVHRYIDMTCAKTHIKHETLNMVVQACDKICKNHGISWNI